MSKLVAALLPVALISLLSVTSACQSPGPGSVEPFDDRTADDGGSSVDGDPDTTPPSAPTGLVAHAASTSSIELDWAESSDDRAVSSYRVYRDGVAVANTLTTSYADVDLEPGTSYCYRVSARDAGGNESVRSEESCTSTLAPPVEMRTVTVALAGDGFGWVVGEGILCGPDCSEPFAIGALVTLTAELSLDARLGGWLGCDDADGLTCTLVADTDRTVTATFLPPLPRYELSLSLAGAGNGSIGGPGLDCGVDCVEAYDEGAVVQLSAAPAADSYFAAWAGCDAASGASCTVTMSAARSVSATFLPITYDLSVAKSGPDGALGDGTVSASGITCGADCSEAYPSGATVTLTVAADAASLFVGWSGCDSEEGTTCTVSMLATREVTARFLGAVSYSGTTLGGLKALSPTLTFADLTLTGALALTPADGSPIVITARSFTLTGSVRFTQSECSYLASPTLAIVASGAAVIDGTIDLSGKPGDRIAEDATCKSCDGVAGGDIDVTAASITVSPTGKLIDLDVDGGYGASVSFYNGVVIGCDGAPGGTIRLAASGAVTSRAGAMLEMEGGNKGYGKDGLGTDGPDGWQELSGSTVTIYDHDLKNALLQNANTYTYQRMTLAGETYNGDDTSERNVSGALYIGYQNGAKDWCEDLYVVQVRSATNLRFALAVGNPNWDMDIALVDTNFTRIYAIGNGPTGVETISYNASAGEYVLCVTWPDNASLLLSAAALYKVELGS